ncbi:hypothetical protein ACFQDD_00640 [Halorubrum pallidum]|uniref:HNH endonuclease n=1 Tax=Halorubrum pallidum TaxID=1526114 RepID=A0ABD5T3G4_9EURY
MTDMVQEQPPRLLGEQIGGAYSPVQLEIIEDYGAEFEDEQYGRKLTQTVIANADNHCENCNALAGPHGYEVLHPVPLGGDPPSLYEGEPDPERFRALCLTCISDLTEEIGDGDSDTMPENYSLPDPRKSGVDPVGTPSGYDWRDGRSNPRPKSRFDDSLSHDEVEAALPGGMLQLLLNPIGQYNANRFLPHLQPVWKFSPEPSERPEEYSLTVRSQRRMWRRILRHQDKKRPFLHFIKDYLLASLIRIVGLLLIFVTGAYAIGGLATGITSALLAVPVALLVGVFLFVIHPYDSKYRSFRLDSLWHRWNDA